MDSSDDEGLFDAPPACDKSKRPNLTRTSEGTKKQKHFNICAIRDVSVKLLRVPDKQDIVSSAFKEKPNFRSIRKRKPKKKQIKMEEFEQPQKLQIVKKLGDDITENKNKSPRDNPDKKTMKIRNNMQVNRRSNETATLRTSRYQDKLPYTPQQKKNKVLCSETDAKVSSLVLDNENKKQYSCSNKANMSDQERISPQPTTISTEKKGEYNDRNPLTGRIISTHKKLSQCTREHSTCYESPDEHFTVKKRKRCRPITSDESSSDEDIITNNTKNNIKNGPLFHKVIDQEESQSTDVPVVRLIKLEEMNNIYFKQWQERNVPQIIAATRYQLSCPNKISSSNNKEKLNVMKKLKTTSNLKKSKYHAIDTLNVMKLRTKYKLFETFKITMIKLEALGYSSKNGTYSATEIDHLMKKYLYRIKHNFKYTLTHLPKEKTALTSTKENSRKSGNVFHISSDNISSETSIVKENAVEDCQTDQNVKNENNPSKTDCKSASAISHKTLTPELTASSTNEEDSQVKPLEILPKTLKPQGIFTNTSVSIQSPSTFYLSQLAPRETKVDSENINNQLSCLSSKKYNVSTLSEEFTLPKITLSETSMAETSLKSIATYNEISIPKLSNNTILPNNLNIEQVVCNNDLSQSKENLVTKNVFASKRKEMSTSLNSPVLNMLSKNTLLKLANKACEISTDHTIDKKLQTVIPMKKAKNKMYKNRHPLLKKKKGLYNCRICTISFLDYKQFHKHLVNDRCETNNVNHPVINASKSLKSSELEQTIIDEKYNLESPELSISQQSSSIDKDSDMHLIIQSFINSDDKNSSLSSLISKKPRSKIKSIKKSKSINLNLENKTQNHKAKSHKKKISQKKIESAQQITCNICSRIFDSYVQLSEHIFKHTQSDLQNAYMSMKNKTLPACPPEINDINDQMLNCTNKNQINVEKIETFNDRTKEQKLENTVSSNILENGLVEMQHDASKNKSLSKLQQVKDIINKNWNELFLIVDREDETNTQSTVNEMENNIEKCSETFSESQLVKSITICECHKNEVIENVGIQIEIILFCNICQMLFRRNECFETHYRFSQGSCCERNRREDRIPNFFCSCCLKMLNSPKDMLHHLEWHAESNRNNTVTFRCNICKVIFYGIDLVFKAHFYNHVKNPFFVASRFSFSKNFFIGSKVIKAVGKKPEVFIQVADYICQRCKMPFLSEKNMKCHEKNCCENGKNINSLIVNSTVPLHFKNIHILLLCGFCDTYFPNLTAFESHSFMHKQKRNLEAHYTCVTLSNMKKVYICNVCGISCQSVKSSKEHLSTHGILKEDYICSKCNKHFTSISFFLEHVGTHKEDDNMSIKCKVIYYDTKKYICDSQKSNYKYDAKQCIIGIDIPYMTLSYFKKKESAESTTGIKSSTYITIENNPSTKIDDIFVASSIDDEILIIDTSEDNNSPIQKLSSKNVIITESEHPATENAIENGPKINDNEKITNSTDNLDDSNNKLILENEENLTLNTEQTNNVLSHVHTHGMSNVQIADTETSFNNATLTIDTVEEVFNDIENLGTNTKSNVTTKESLTSSTSDNVSESNTMTKIDNKSITDLTIAQDDNRIEIQSLTLNPSSSTSPKNLSSGNTTESAPKSFLRVKSLTELMSPSKKDSAVLHDSSIDTSQKWEKHLQLRNHFTENRKTALIPLTSNNSSETWGLESRFRSPMHSSTVIFSPINLSNHDFRTVSHNTENYLDKTTRPPPPPSPPPPYHATHTNPLHMFRYSVAINNTTNNIVNTQKQVTWIPPYAPRMMNTQLPPKPIYYQNPPNHTIYQPTSKSTQSNQQYYDNVQSHMQTSYQSSRPPQLIAQQSVNSNNLLHNNNTILPAQNSTLISSVNQNNMQGGNTMPMIRTVSPSAPRPRIQENFICHSCPNFMYKSKEEFMTHLFTMNHKV